MGRRPVGGIFSVGLEEPYRWKDSVQSEPEIRLWVAEGTANGMRPWVTKFSGVLYDRRWLPMVERIYDWHFRHERYLRNEEPLARVALLHSEQTATYHAGVAQGDRPGRSRARHVPRARRGAHAVRPRARSVSHARSARSLQTADPRRCGGALRRAVRRDPRLTSAAAAASSRRSPRRSTTRLGVRRTTSASPISSACRSPGAIDGPMQNSYLNLDADPATERRHPILDGLDDTPRIINGVFRLAVRPAGELSVADHADSHVSGPADGGRLPARRAHGHARAVSARSRPRAASSTFRGTSIARSGTCCASIT